MGKFLLARFAVFTACSFCLLFYLYFADIFSAPQKSNVTATACAEEELCPCVDVTATVGAPTAEVPLHFCDGLGLDGFVHLLFNVPSEGTVLPAVCLIHYPSGLECRYIQEDNNGPWRNYPPSEICPDLPNREQCDLTQDDIDVPSIIEGDSLAQYY